MTEIDQLFDALISAQALEKKLRGLRNKGLATDADVADAKAAIEAIRSIYARHCLMPTDIDQHKRGRG